MSELNKISHDPNVIKTLENRGITSLEQIALSTVELLGLTKTKAQQIIESAMVKLCEENVEVIDISLMKIEIILKNTSRTERVNVDAIDNIYDEIRDREVKEFRVLNIKDLGKLFSNRRKFVEIIETMLINYYSSIIQFLSKWTELAPRIIEKNKVEPLKEVIIPKKEKEENKENTEA